MGDPEQFAGGREFDRDDVQSHIVIPPYALHITLGQLAQFALLSDVHPLFRRACASTPARFDLNDDQKRAFTGDDVDLSQMTTPIANKNAHALADEQIDGQLFSQCSELFASAFHKGIRDGTKR